MPALANGRRLSQHAGMRRNALPVVMVVSAWWTLYALVSAAQLLGMEGPGGEVLATRRAFAMAFASAGLWIPISLLLLWCVERFPVRRGQVLRPLLAYAGLTAAVVMLRALAVAVLNPWIGWYQALPPWPSLLLASVLNNVILLWLMVGAAHAWWYARRAAERERHAERLQARLVASRLEALSAQLNPHFLFNALNSIAEMVHRDPGAADRMLVGLGDLLRASLDHHHVHEVPLGEELALLRHYLEIESHRLGDRLRVDWQVAAGLDDALVPPLLLQPLAENAIVHAIATRGTPGELAIRVGSDGDGLWLEVRDDGGDGGSAQHGTGLANLRARLECLHGALSEVALHRNEDGGTSACVRLPLRRMPRARAA